MGNLTPNFLEQLSTIQGQLEERVKKVFKSTMMWNKGLTYEEYVVKIELMNKTVQINISELPEEPNYWEGGFEIRVEKGKKTEFVFIRYDEVRSISYFRQPS
jgi:hypothetical protein